MDTTQQILAVISIILVFILVGPSVFRLNMARGTTLRNIVIWLLIFVALVWVYQFMHPAPATPELTPDGAPIPQNTTTM